MKHKWLSKGKHRGEYGRLKSYNGRGVKYNISVIEYNELFKKQGGVCAICKQVEISRRTFRLSIDHDHNTGKVRGLLCQRCNSAIGFLRDDPEIAKNAEAYLRRFSGV